MYHGNGVSIVEHSVAVVCCCCRETTDREARKARNGPVVLFRKLFETPGENNEKIPNQL